MSMLIRTAEPTDLRAIEHLLTSLGLTTVGVSEHFSGFLVAEDGETIVASAAMEVYGSSALLRSVAVHPDYQGRRIARQLVARLLERAQQNGVQRVYLLTTTAAAYFRRLGFKHIQREEVDRVVQSSLEFQVVCCEGATAMQFVLTTHG